jgi:hypothetical protein
LFLPDYRYSLAMLHADSNRLLIKFGNRLQFSNFLLLVRSDYASRGPSAVNEADVSLCESEKSGRRFQTHRRWPTIAPRTDVGLEDVIRRHFTFPGSG